MPNKTKPESTSVDAFLAKVTPEVRRRDGIIVRDLFQRVSGLPATMWGPSIIGYGSYHYRYESGREGDAPRLGFSPRSTALVFYIMDGFPRYDTLMKQLGKFTTGKSCVYVKKLDDIDIDVLEQLAKESLAHMKRQYP